MPKISIVTFYPAEIPLVLAACEFFPISKDLELELICPAEDIPKPQGENLRIKGLEDNTIPIPTPEHICFFASSASYKYYCLQKKLNSVLLYVHPEIAVLELIGNYPFHTNLASYGLCPCVLEGDFAASLDPQKENLLCFKEFSEFIDRKKQNYVLLSSNSRFVEALINMDSENWELFHPELNYRNLQVNSGKPHNKLLNAQKQLLNMSRPLNELYNLAEIRFYLKNIANAYSCFAEHYDKYMLQVDYSLWVHNILKWFNEYSSLKLNKILELACGTANVSIQLVQKGYDVTACDKSLDMLKAAAEKPVKPKLYYASLTDPIPANDYQLVLCMFDSINYLTQISQIATMLQEVSLALVTGGLFIFDISTLENSIDNFSHLCDLHYYANDIMVHQAYFESSQLLQISNLHFFKKIFLGYNLQTEHHQQRVYLTYELIELINNSPLKLIAIHSIEIPKNLYPRHLSSIDDKYDRLFFILQKD
ncbi:MAG: Mg-protoporphyrin IX methyl transferase [Candidatus Cloacimonetes bacterium ADurb.Bin089]|nr:MAG: Mg-protoporphyrin IX methyl transferase [Candidatus Cloacimonetes bacterium ADurb.Bin089]